MHKFHKAFNDKASHLVLQLKATKQWIEGAQIQSWVQNTLLNMVCVQASSKGDSIGLDSQNYSKTSTDITFCLCAMHTLLQPREVKSRMSNKMANRVNISHL